MVETPEAANARAGNSPMFRANVQYFPIALGRTPTTSESRGDFLRPLGRIQGNPCLMT